MCYFSDKLGTIDLGTEEAKNISGCMVNVNSLLSGRRQLIQEIQIVITDYLFNVI